MNFPIRSNRTEQRAGFTLIELLIVISIFLILTAVALPTVRELIAGRKITGSARSLIAFADVARSRAITDGRPVGILLKRDPVFAGFASTTVEQLIGVPPYSGDASNAVMSLTVPTGSTIVTATFDEGDSQLLALAASMIGEPNAPIRTGDLLELPGGRRVPIVLPLVSRPIGSSDPLSITFDTREITSGSGIQSATFPAGNALALATIPPPPTNPPLMGVGRIVHYKILRTPSPSRSVAMNLPRDAVIDLTYSGIGRAGNDFASGVAVDVAIIFGSDGQIIAVTQPDGSLAPPRGQVFLCVGNSDGVKDVASGESLFSQERKAVANLLNLDSVWIVFSQSTGRVFASANASVTSIPSAAVTNVNDASLPPAISEARLFASLSDTLETK